MQRQNRPSGVLPDQLFGYCVDVKHVEGSPSLLPLSCQLSQHCSRTWTVRQLTVENAIRRRICQYRHGFSYARSATMMDDTLIIVSLEP